MDIAKTSRRVRDPTKALAGLVRISYFDGNGECFFTEYQKLNHFIPTRLAEKADGKLTEAFQNVKLLPEILQRKSNYPQISRGAEYV